MANNISVTVLTKNSEAYLAECLDALKPFSEVVVLDNGSTDRTLALARSFSNVKVYEHPFIGFGPMKNLAVDKASNDWILSVDSDEIVTPGLAREILNVDLDTSCLYAMVRDNYYHGRLIRGCGWQNDQLHRLFNRKECRFNNKLVHEGIEKKEGMKTVLLKGRLKHYSYDNASQLLQKMQYYSTLWAEENQSRKKASPFKALLYGIVAFFKSYVLRNGWLDGYEGLLISISNANGVFYKYIMLYESFRFSSNKSRTHDL